MKIESKEKKELVEKYGKTLGEHLYHMSSIKNKDGYAQAYIAIKELAAGLTYLEFFDLLNFVDTRVRVASGMTTISTSLFD